MEDRVRFKKQQENLLLMEKNLEVFQQLRNSVNRYHENYKVFKQSFMEWKDHIAEEEEENAVKVEEIVAVQTEAIPKEIPLSSVLENSFKNPMLCSQPSDFPLRILLSSINTPYDLNLIKTESLIDDGVKNSDTMNPINTVFVARRLIGCRISDASIQSDITLWPFKHRVVVIYMGEAHTSVDKHVEFPLDLDLQPYNTGSQNNGVELKYNLYAIIVHIGFSSIYGHYFCLIWSSLETWYCLDDSKVTSVQEEFVPSQETYILFYARQGTCDTPNLSLGWK
ncbi:ubiquitin carboxyl-terminal hydrolase 3-like [Juglans microcarpa x Juglans regia]|uniref:ubiquitin carboxyl-terminal hydrolase 3-like n=1 Tax=Juglans microcarpa x Juglans regia TaxID=2249226 RepID=UPI001B7DBB58|nr:ubiquitin carboxyl-terminal hydrolase 3-like [Juglans microcarpa x Juglans regia]